MPNSEMARPEQTNNTEISVPEISNIIPPQYEGLPSEVVEELWEKTIYADPEKNKQEEARRTRALKEIRQKEEDEIKIAEIRKSIGIDEVTTPTENQTSPPIESVTTDENLSATDYETFKVKNGETDQGVYWYEFSNTAAKTLKEAGKLEWGKERIYFDIPLKDMEQLKNIALEIAKKEKIAIAFKHLDTEKTNQIDLSEGSETTRFVTNFATTKDAKKFYEALSQNQNYLQMQPDRKIDYHGHDLDGKAHYASGYREKREPLKRIFEKAIKNPDGTFRYPNADGTKIINISAKQFEDFKKQFDALPDPKTSWEKA